METRIYRETKKINLEDKEKPVSHSLWTKVLKMGESNGRVIWIRQKTKVSE